jgi:hypothetical protein
VIRRYQQQIDLVIVGGGDGTLNATIEAIIETQLPLGILPLGTANDLARTLAIPNSLPEACQIIASGNLRRIDLGSVNGKYFFNVASLGLSVKITQQLTKEIKRRWGIFAYAAIAFQVIVIKVVLRIYDAGGNIAFTMVGDPVNYTALTAPLNFQLEQFFPLVPLEGGFSVGVDVLANKITDDDAALYFQETINDFGVEFFSDFTSSIFIAVPPNDLPLYDPATRKTLSYEFEQPISFEQVQLIINNSSKRIDFTYGFNQLQTRGGFIDTVQINNLDSFETNFKLLTNQ